MTPSDADILAAAALLRDIFQPVVDRLDALEARFAAIEQRPIGAIDAGVWKPGQVYQRGDGVTYDGAFWVAQRETRREPGDGRDDWRLCVSRGKVGKDGKPGRDAETFTRRAS